MNDELEAQLAEDHPEILGLLSTDPDELDGPTPQLCTYGLQCGDGWYDLIDTLCQELDRLGVKIEAVQIKEKFGGLRFYHNGVSHDDERRAFQAMGAIQFAQSMSFEICERCGDSGERRDGGWIRTLCDDCQEDVIKERRNRVRE